MGRVRLYYLDRDQQHLRLTNGGGTTVTFLRLLALVRLPQVEQNRDGLIDTGSALTFFSELLWRQFERKIEWLHFPAHSNPPPWWTTVTGLTGGSYTCRLGRISLSIFDFQKNELKDIPVVAKFLNDGGELRERVIFGLSHGILHRRVITVDPDAREAWLEDRA